MKKNFFKKNKKIILFFLPLFFVVTLIYMGIFHLNILVSLGFRAFTYGTMNVKNVKILKGSNFSFGTIELENSKIYYKKELISDTPKVVIKYENMKIDEINIYNPKVKLVRNGSDINFVEIFTGSSENDSEEDKDPKKTKELKDPILKKINIYNADLNFVDRSYSNEISQKAKNVNGYIVFKKDYNVYLIFRGNNQQEKYYYSFENSDDFYEMQIKGENIKANSELLQYGYDSDGEITDVKGITNIDLKINSNGFFGKGSLKNGELFYKDLDVPVKDIELNLNFLGEKITIDGNYNFLDNKGKFNVNYEDEKGVLVDFIFKNISYKDLANYKYLKNLNMKFDNFIFNDLDIKISTENDFKVLIDFDSEKGFNQNLIYLSKLKGQFIYEKESMRLKDLQGNIKFLNDNELIERNFLGNLFYKDDRGKIDLNLNTGTNNFLSNIDLSFLFKTKENSLDFRVNSEILDLSGKYDYKENRIFLNQKRNFNFIYNLNNKEIDKLKGYIDLKLENYLMRTKIDLEDKTKLIVSSKITDEKNKKEIKNIGEIQGNFDIEKLIYDFKIKIEGIKLAYKNMVFTGNINGYLKGEKDQILGEIKIDDTGFELPESKFSIKNILGTIFIEKKEALSIIFQGEIGKVTYDKNEINGFKASVKYTDNSVEILDIRNKFLTLKGNYSIINSRISLLIQGKDIDKNIFNFNDYNYDIQEIQGKVFGDISNIKAKFQIKNGNIYFTEDRNISFNGTINYFKNMINSRNFLVNRNRISFNYNLNKKRGKYQAVIFENTLSQFIKNIKFKVIGISTGTIENTNIHGNFNGSIEDVYFKGKQIPNLGVKCSYDNEKIDFKKLFLFSVKDRKNIVSSKGYIDIKNNLLSFKVLKQKVYIKEIFEDENLLGKVFIDGKLEGSFDKISYYLNGTDGDISYNNIVVNNITFKVDGDSNKFNLNKFSLNYEGNTLLSSGFYSIKDNNYNFKLNSKKIDFKFLSVFLNPLDINDISGDGKIDLVFRDIVPTGDISFNNLKLSSKKYGLDFSNFNGKLKFKDGFLKIDKFLGKLNNGSLNIKGFLEIKQVLESILAENFKQANYSLLLDGRNINYSFEDYFKLNFNTRLSMKNNKIFGNILLNNGEINKIIDKDLGVIKIIKNFIKDFFNKNKIKKSVANDILEEENRFSDFKVNVGFRIDKGIKLDVEKATNFITDIKGNIFGDGILRGNIGKINFLGESDIKDGEFTFNGTKFDVDRAIILFNNPNEYIPDLNPSINFSTTTVLDSKNVEFSLDGPFKNLTFTVRSGNKVSVNSLDSIISDEGIKQDESSDLSIMIANLIGGQLADVVLNPVVNILRSMGFKHLRVKSSLITEEKNKNRTEHEDNSKVFGAYIEAENPIYKDKLFWRIKANFVDEAKNYSERNSREAYGVADYDVNIYHRLNKNFLWGVGAQKLREDLERKGNKDVNYYIELKFEKRFNFRNGGLE